MRPPAGLGYRTGASLNDADRVRIVGVESKQRLLGSDHAVRVFFSVVAEQAHGDAVRHGANRPVVAGEIVGAANFAGLACTTHQLLDLAALAGVEVWLAGVELRIERHDPPISPRLYATTGGVVRAAADLLRRAGEHKGNPARLARTMQDAANERRRILVQRRWVNNPVA